MQIDTMIVSPFVRTQETAENINTSLNMSFSYDDRIVELRVGKFE